MSIPPQPLEKSTFERAIIEAFKQQTSKDIYSKLTIAYDEIKYHIDETKKSQPQKYILNKNILTKLSHITERKFFPINILISRIYESLLDPSNFPFLSQDISLLISFCNDILNMLDILKSTSISKCLDKKCACFLNYLSKHSSFILEDEQKETINELINSLPSRDTSEVYLTFSKKKDNIIRLCKSNDVNSKMEGVYMLINSFGDVYSLEEQFDLLLEYCPQIIKAITTQPNPEYHNVYFKLGEFMVSMLYSFKFKIKADTVITQTEAEMKKLSSQSFFIIEPDDTTTNNEDNSNNSDNKQLPIKDDYSSFKFLNNTLFELTTQKELLLKCENIFSLCQLLLNTLSIYDSILKLQYICYLICKKIYFFFPQFTPQIEETICLVLINLCQFKNPEERLSTIECRQFLHYLLSNGSSTLKTALNERIQSKQNLIDITLEEGTTYDQIDIEYDILNLSNFNLRIGYPSYYSIDAGSQYERYIEIENDNSMVYIGFTTLGYDITFQLQKYNETSGSFEQVITLNRINSSDLPVKVVLYVKKKGVYKIIYDNTYSWFTPKTVRHRLSVLKMINGS